jgi:hypothetical protein
MLVLQHDKYATKGRAVANQTTQSAFGTGSSKNLIEYKRIADFQNHLSHREASFSPVARRQPSGTVIIRCCRRTS